MVVVLVRVLVLGLVLVLVLVLLLVLVLVLVMVLASSRRRGRQWQWLRAGLTMFSLLHGNWQRKACGKLKKHIKKNIINEHFLFLFFFVKNEHTKHTTGILF